jgi:hypothetical protein
MSYIDYDFGGFYVRTLGDNELPNGHLLFGYFGRQRLEGNQF